MGLIKIKKESAKIGLALWFAGMWSWSLQTDSLELAGNKKQGLIIAFIVLLINVFISTGVILFFMTLANLIKRKVTIWIFIPILLILFSLADFMAAWVPAVLWIGPQGRIDSVLPLGSASLLLLRTPFIFSSRLVGFYGLASFVWVFLYLFIIKSLRKFSVVPVILLSVLSLIGWGLYKKPNGHTISAVIVSETLTERRPPISVTDENLVLFPEYGFDKIDNQKLKNRIISASGNTHKTYFIGSMQVYKKSRMGHENRLYEGNTKEGFTTQQDKYRLIPGGEDLPYIVNIALRATGQNSTINYFSYAKSVIKGDRQLTNFEISPGVRIGSAVCSSIIAPQDYRTFTKNGATILTNSASLKPFNGSRLFAWQQQSYGRFMAVANSRYFLQSANSASAYVFDNNGKKIIEVSNNKTAKINIVSNDTVTIYTRFGEVMVWLGAFSTIVIILLHYARFEGRTKKYIKNFKKWLST